MKILSWGQRPITDPIATAVTAGRWVFEVCVDSVGVFEERADLRGEWDHSGRYAGLWWRGDIGWAWGYHEAEYDGLHQVLRLGLIELAWCTL